MTTDDHFGNREEMIARYRALEADLARKAEELEILTHIAANRGMALDVAHQQVASLRRELGTYGQAVEQYKTKLAHEISIRLAAEQDAAALRQQLEAAKEAKRPFTHGNEVIAGQVKEIDRLTALVQKERQDAAALREERDRRHRRYHGMRKQANINHEAYRKIWAEYEGREYKPLPNEWDEEDNAARQANPEGKHG